MFLAVPCQSMQCKICKFQATQPVNITQLSKSTAGAALHRHFLGAAGLKLLNPETFGRENVVD